jgi:ADP-ribose pyrophosphatase YjhB (NUDIX family)
MSCADAETSAEASAEAETRTRTVSWVRHAPSRRFDCRNVVPLAAPLMSVYTVPGAPAALEHLKLPDNHYIIGVTYNLEDCILNATGDSQLFVTGTVSNGERPAAACVREVCEEVMMKPKILNHIHSIMEVKGRNKRQINWYSCKVTDLEQLMPLNTTTPQSTDGRNKVSCILYGTYEEVIELFGRIPLAPVAGDEIIGLVALRAGDVKYMLKHIPRSYRRWDHFFWYHNGSTKDRPRRSKDIYAFSGAVLPLGSAATIRRAIDTMAPILGPAAQKIIPPYCEDMECLAPAAANSIYCGLHRLTGITTPIIPY